MEGMEGTSVDLRKIKRSQWGPFRNRQDEREEVGTTLQKPSRIVQNGFDVANR